MIAHRGNSSEAPENTLSAFKSAAFSKIPYIEFDLHLTKDGIPVILHDRFLSRTTGLQHPTPIEELTFSEIKSLDCGKWFNPLFQGKKILGLKELLEAPLENIGLMVEIKEGSASDELLVSSVVEEIAT